MGVQVPPFALPLLPTAGSGPAPSTLLSGGPSRSRDRGGSLRRLAVVTLAIATFGACADPGAAALDRTIRGLDALVAIAERHARGDLDAAGTASAISAWQRSEGMEITSLSHDAARALGRTLRRALEARWKGRSGPLVERVRELSSDFDGLR